jgi:predicted AlkP superfamily pyrophosphatase or phosphodiesterase
MGSLFLVAKDGYAFTADPGQPVVVDAPPASLGSHGYVATDPDLRALFIASGRGIRRGVTIEDVAAIDLAPTMGHLLGVEMKGVEGKILTQILSIESPAGADRRE